MIKSVVKLRPVRHRTDVKVRARVALCMLALYVQWELTLKLGKDDILAELAFEHLETCHVDLYAGRGAARDAYVVPLPTREQTKILRTLGLTRLVDQREEGLALRPRSEFASTSEEEVAQRMRLREMGGQNGEAKEAKRLALTAGALYVQKLAQRSIHDL